MAFPNVVLYAAFCLQDLFLSTLTFFLIIYVHFRFLWRKNATFAISRHYKRFDVFAEAEANKAAGKYANASIDFQVDFYRREGLTPYSVEKLPITSGGWNFLCLLCDKLYILC